METSAETAPPLTVPEGEPQKLHPAIKKVWRIGAIFSTLLWLLMFGLPEFFLIRALEFWPVRFPVIAPVVAILLGLLSISMAGKQYENWRYTLREQDLILSYGVLWKTQRCVARGRIQHVDINSGPVDRRFGLVQVSLYTAGALGSVGSIPGLKPEEAEALREALLESRAPDA